MFNRSSDHQCRAAKRPSLTRANRLCHYHRLSAKLQTLSRSRSRQKMPHLPLSYCLVQLRAKLRWHRLQGHLATSWLLRRPSQLTNSFLRDLMSANLADIESQLEIQLEGRTAVDHIPDGLSTLSQYLLYRQQLLDNPFPEQRVMAPWQALRSNAARTALVRKYQRPFASLKDPERFRCAQFLLSLFFGARGRQHHWSRRIFRLRELHFAIPT